MSDLGIDDRCQNPEHCKKRRVAFAAQNERMLNLYGYAEFEEFNESLVSENGKINKNVFKQSHHIQKRSFERVFSQMEISTILKDGDIIEYWQNREEKKMLVWGNIYNKNAKVKYRPVHIVLRKNSSDDKWTVSTIYNPETMQWKWDKSLTKRICFCKVEEEGF